MKQRLHAFHKRIQHDPRLKRAIDSIRPKRTFWGVAGIVLFFFVPEMITYIWQPELVSWAHLHTITEPTAMQRALYAQLEKMFADGVSRFNIALGSLLLIWVWRMEK